MQRHEKTEEKPRSMLCTENWKTTFKKNMMPEKYILWLPGSTAKIGCRRLDLTDPGKLSGNGCDV